MRRVPPWQAIPLQHGPQTVGPDRELQESGHTTCLGTMLSNVSDEIAVLISHVPGKDLYILGLSWAPTSPSTPADDQFCLHVTVSIFTFNFIQITEERLLQFSRL